MYALAGLRDHFFAMDSSSCVSSPSSAPALAFFLLKMAMSADLARLCAAADYAYFRLAASDLLYHWMVRSSLYYCFARICVLDRLVW